MAKKKNIEIYTFTDTRLMTGDELLQYVFEYYKKHFNQRAFIGGYSREMIRCHIVQGHYRYEVEVITVK
jgi:hypothetical protein